VKITLKGTVTREQISSQLDLDVSFETTYRTGFTIVEYAGEDHEIFCNYLKNNFELGYLMSELNSDIYPGRLVDVGKYGFGIFCDINSQKEALISLNSLRETFGKKLPTREYIYKKGLVNGLCVNVRITRIERGTDQIWAEIDKEWADKYLKRGYVTISRADRRELESIIKNSSFRNSLGLIPLCKDSFAISCKEGIDPPGIVNFIGSRLKDARLGIVGEI